MASLLDNYMGIVQSDNKENKIKDTKPDYIDRKIPSFHDFHFESDDDTEEDEETSIKDAQIEAFDDEEEDIEAETDNKAALSEYVDEDADNKIVSSNDTNNSDISMYAFVQTQATLERAFEANQQTTKQIVGVLENVAGVIQTNNQVITSMNERLDRMEEKSHALIQSEPKHTECEAKIIEVKDQNSNNAQEKKSGVGFVLFGAVFLIVAVFCAIYVLQKTGIGATI